MLDPREEMMAMISGRQNRSRAEENGHELPDDDLTPEDDQPEDQADDESVEDTGTEVDNDQDLEGGEDLEPEVAEEQDPVVESKPEVEPQPKKPFAVKLNRESVDLKESLKGVVAAIEDGDQDAAVDMLEAAIRKGSVTEDDLTEAFNQRDEQIKQEQLQSRGEKLQAIEDGLMQDEKYKIVFEDPDMMAVASRKMKELNGKVSDDVLFQQSLDHAINKFGGLGASDKETTRQSRKASMPSPVRPRAARKAKEVEAEVSPQQKRAQLLDDLRKARGQ